MWRSQGAICQQEKVERDQLPQCIATVPAMQHLLEFMETVRLTNDLIRALHSQRKQGLKKRWSRENIAGSVKFL